VRGYCTGIVDAGLAAAKQARARLPGARFIDISHAQLTADPLAVVRHLGERLRLGFHDTPLSEATRWLAGQRVHTPRRPSAATSGLQLR
jgi:hypothetical protein